MIRKKLPKFLVNVAKSVLSQKCQNFCIEAKFQAQKIYIKLLLKPKNTNNKQCLKSFYKGKNEKNAFVKNSSKCPHFCATLSFQTIIMSC